MLAGLPVAALLGAPLFAAAAEDVESSGAGAPTPTCMGEAATILGSPGNDRGKKRIVGTGDADVIVSFGGRDQIKGKGGPDLICSGPGSDTVRGGRGADEIKGGAGKDELRGNAHGDEIDGGRGGDRLNGGAGKDRCRGGKGKDKKRSCELSGKGSPKAKKDRAAVNEGSTTTVDVLANDSDPRGRALRVVAVDDSGAAGSATLRRGQVEYEPGPAFEPLAAGQTGSDTFTYKIKNSRGKRDSANVDVTISGLDDPSKVTATPALYPDFSPEISDYVIRCSGDPVELEAVAGPGNTINLDGQGAKGGASSAQVSLQPNQRFSFVRRTGSGATTHHVRCLPADFPEWTFQRFAAPEQQFYVFAVGAYVFALDGRGVPVWWFNDDGQPSDAKLLSDGTFAWASDRATPDSRYDIRAVDGGLVRELKTVGTETDGHDLQLLPNGNYMLMSYKPRSGVDVSAYDPAPGSDDATVTDAELQEIDPDDPANPVWSWNSGDGNKIDLAEADHWWEDWIIPFRAGGPYDVVHINSADVDGNSVVISNRHTDGVYKIDKATGHIVWKLGGTTTPESLDVIGDPLSPDTFGGQHDARYTPGTGILTVFDNGETHDRLPRAVRFRIDETAGTATYLESISDPDVPQAVCCGSARRSETGGWLVGWGGGTFQMGVLSANPVSEFAADGSRTFRVDFDPAISYRAHPVPFGELSAAALRAGMDSQHPR